MQPKFDSGKPVQTRNGLKARIVATDVKREGYTLLALVETEPGREEGHTYTAEGQFVYRGDRPLDMDLVNIPEKRVLYLNVYGKNDIVNVHTSRSRADANAGGDRTARVKIEFVEGQFDE